MQLLPIMKHEIFPNEEDWHWKVFPQTRWTFHYGQRRWETHIVFRKFYLSPFEISQIQSFLLLQHCWQKSLVHECQSSLMAVVITLVVPNLPTRKLTCQWKMIWNWRWIKLKWWPCHLFVFSYLRQLESNGSQNHNFRGFKLIAHLPDDPQVLERLAFSEMSPLKTKLSLRLIYRADIIMTMLWGSCQMCKIAGFACAGNAGNVFPATDFRGNRWLAIPACITARASRTCRDACRDS